MRARIALRRSVALTCVLGAEMKTFSRMVKLVAFRPFPSAEVALDNALQLSEGAMTPLLKDFLHMAFPKGQHTLGVAEERLGGELGCERRCCASCSQTRTLRAFLVSIQENLSIACEKNAKIAELLRGIRMHFAKFVIFYL